MKRITYLCLLLLFLAACTGTEAGTAPTLALPAATIPLPTATEHVIPTLIPTAQVTLSPPPSPTTPPTAIPPTAATSVPCEIVAAESLDVYQRPSQEAGIFGTLDPGFRPRAQARTPDGAWIGFDPAVAQAANVGVFRLRWVPAASVTLEGGCANLEVVEGPPPGVCFTMPMTDTIVYAAPEPAAAEVTTMTYGDYTAVLGYYGDTWAQVDLDVGNVSATGQGWVQATTLNMNGTCDLPQVTP